MVGIAKRLGLSPAEEMRLKQLAIQLVSQLPSDINHAMLCLDLARELVEKFLAPAKPTMVLVKPVERP